MSPKKAKKELVDLGKMHQLLAKSFLNRLEHEQTCTECDRGLLSGQELTAIRQFLSDNGVTGTAVTPEDEDPLTDDLPFVDPELENPTP